MNVYFDLNERADALAAAVAHVWQSIDGTNGFIGDPLPEYVAARQAVEDAHRQLQDVRALLDSQIGDLMDAHTVVVDGVGAVTRHRKKSRTKWDREALLPDVLDSRVVTSDGEILDESPLDKVLRVWNLGAPRVTALKERGLDPDEYCAVEIKDGWSIEVAASDGFAERVREAKA